MNKFRTRPSHVEAEQWFPGKGVPGVEQVETGGLMRHCVTTRLGRKTPVYPGDWVVVDPVSDPEDGQRYYTCSDSMFRSLYEPVE